MWHIGAPGCTTGTTTRTSSRSRSSGQRSSICLEFEECPQCVRTYVALMAERVFKDKFTAAAAPSPITAEEMEALRNVEDQEAQQGDYNMLTGSWSVANILQRE
jgi:hypothetical protein